MSILLWLLALGLVLLAMFAVANWALLTAPASLDFLVLAVEGPLGLVLLATTAVLLALCVAYVLWLRTATLVEMRSQAKELDTQRALAASAEASRLTELRAHMDAEGARQRVLAGEAQVAISARLEALERTLVDALADTSNSIAACVGEVDEKLDRLAPASGSAGERSPVRL